MGNSPYALACSYLGITYRLCVHVARCDGGTSRLPSPRFFRLRAPRSASQCDGPGLFLAFFGRRNHVGLWVLHQQKRKFAGYRESRCFA